jgi:DHA2 family multidrug resistance protein-like MFS transporter
VQTTNEFGLGLGIATLGTAVYRSHVQGALATMPSDIADAARESIDRAVAVAGQLPAELGGPPLDTARDAFTSGLHVVAVVSAVLYAGLTVVTVRAFKHATTN